jgi:dTDP-4-amino-4,6-dideoxygalactose transaminase
MDEWTSQRRAAAVRYTERLSSMDGVVLPFEPDYSRAVYHLYVIRTPNRDALIEQLKAHNVSYGFHYPQPLHLQKCYSQWNYGHGSLPITESAANEILSLPMFPTLTPEQQQRVCAAIEAAVAERV